VHPMSRSHTTRWLVWGDEVVTGFNWMAQTRYNLSSACTKSVKFTSLFCQAIIVSMTLNHDPVYPFPTLPDPPPPPPTPPPLFTCRLILPPARAPAALLHSP